jgi:hypothetical protein
MTTDWREKLGAALVPVLERTRALPAEPWRLPLVRAVAIVSNGLSATTADADSMAKALAAATREALSLVARALVPPELPSLFGPALNALLAHPHESHLEGVVRKPPAAEPLLRGSRDIPRLLVVTLADDEDVPPPEPVDEAPPPLDDDESPPPAPPKLVEDVERFDPDAPPPPVVRLADEGGESRALRRFHDGVAERALETIGMLARHRTQRRMTEWTIEEGRILACADAVAATGPDCLARTVTFWRASLESPDPWKTWAPCFTLGILDGPRALGAVRDGLRALPPNGVRHATVAAEALAVCPHPDMHALIVDLSRDSHPVARAVGVDLASRAGLLAPEQIAAHLLDTNLPVTIAAIRAAVRCDPPSPALVDLLLLWLRHGEKAVAWEAARAVTILGKADALHDVRAQGELVARLGALGVIELLVMAGEANDVPLVHTLLARIEVNAAHLAAIARLGHPGTWAFLLRYLAQKDFERPASDALATLFGERVPHEARFNSSAWRDAIGAARFDPELRLRRGERWTPSVVAAECTSTAALLSREQVEQRLDELVSRTGIRSDVDLSRWSPVSAPALSGYLAKMGGPSRQWPPGGWGSAVR